MFELTKISMCYVIFVLRNIICNYIYIYINIYSTYLNNIYSTPKKENTKAEPKLKRFKV